MGKTKLTFHLTLPDVKTQLRIDQDYNDEDSFLDNLRLTAHVITEEYIEKDIAETDNVITESIDSSSITIPEGNLINVSEVKLNDVVIDPSEYTVKAEFDAFILSFTGHKSGSLQIKFKTGFEADKCPKSIESAILIKIGELYDQDRTGYVVGSLRETKTFETLLNPYKRLCYRHG